MDAQKNHLVDLNLSLLSRDFCHLLITFSHSFNPDHDRQVVGHDLAPNHLTLCVIAFLKEVFEKVNFFK